MTPVEQTDLHITILRALRAKEAFGCSEAALLNIHIPAVFGREFSPAELEGELRELEGKGWIDAIPSELGPKRWRITPLGESIIRVAKY